MAWDLDPYNLGANNFTPFSQSEWMSKNAGILGTTPMTKAGVCMALTANLFKYYRKNGHYDGYFSWLGGSEAMSEIEKFQTDYMKSATGASDPNVAPAMSISNLLNAFRRTTEDEVFTSMQFGSVDSPATPSFFAVRFFSTFAGQVTAKSGSPTASSCSEIRSKTSIVSLRPGGDDGEKSGKSGGARSSPGGICPAWHG